MTKKLFFQKVGMKLNKLTRIVYTFEQIMNKLAENKDLLPVDVNDDQPESLMIIESVEHTDLANSLFTYFYIIVLSLLIGIFVRSSKEQHISDFFIIDEEASFSFSLSPLNIFNQFIYSDFQIKRINNAKKQLTNASFSVNIKAFKSNHLIQNKTFSGLVRPIFPTRKSIFSAPQRFYFDDAIEFDSIFYSISFRNLSDNYELISIRTVNGRRSIFFLNCALRLLLMIFQLIFLITTYQKLKKESYWHREQKLTLILIVSCLLYDIPLWMFYRYFRFFNTLFTSLFHSFLKIYPISIFAIIREPYMSKTANSQITQIFFFIFLFIAEFSHQKISDISLLSITTPSSSPAGAVISFEFGINLIYITWLIVAIVATSAKLKGTDVSKNYFFTTSIISSIIVYMVSCSFYKFRDSSKCSVDEFVIFIVSNIFVLLVTYFHWPHNTKDEIFYHPVNNESVDLLDSEQSEN